MKKTQCMTKTNEPCLNTAIKTCVAACLLGLTFFTSSPLYALTRVFVNNYQRLDIKIAASDLTHIVVKHDRIQQVRGLKGRYFLDKDDQTGSVYLLPTPAYQTKAFSTFIITDKGKTYTLRCIPSDQPADTVLLTQSFASKSTRSHTPSHSNLNRRLHTMKHRYVYTRHAKRKHAQYHEQHHKQKTSRQQMTLPDFSKPSRIDELSRLLKAMMKHKFIKGYYYRHSFLVHHHYLADKELKVWIPLEYIPKDGRRYHGEFLIVKNNTNHNVVLTPELFQSEQSDVIAIKAPLLKPHAQTRVYRIQRIQPDQTHEHK